ncbi:hypothetical protein POTOM_035771 [Populus tomentosa]|uniref:Uncharacterized protein n=1 Tax=Populus tomentosa TaxID=118781 RepID=A0A8X7Z0Z8_POPTO|nr:hypothetical protein POTOM_035771 [Populus tomentosa]
MSSLGTSKGILEIAKFGVYVTVPVVLMYAFANNTKNLQKFMGNDLVEMEAFEFRLEDKRFPRQQLEMEVIISTRLWMLHTIPKALSEQNPETEVHKEGGEKRRADPRGNFVEALTPVYCSLQELRFWAVTNFHHPDIARSYIVFPSKIVRPPSPEEMRERARELGRRKDTH